MFTLIFVTMYVISWLLLGFIPWLALSVLPGNAPGEPAPCYSASSPVWGTVLCKATCGNLAWLRRLRRQACVAVRGTAWARGAVASRSEVPGK